ncbi:MAG: hypothetical protein M1144_05070 [Candidatus Thermoplasmatota archaeon]|nr:hypothetical protein [Candidatus Thermoplasmatota archaeon]
MAKKASKKAAKSPKSARKAAPKGKKPVRPKKGSAKPKSSKAEEAPAPTPSGPNFPERLLTLSFLRDEGEFCVRLEKPTGSLTELKNRSPDLLLRMVAGELEDLLG